MRRGVVGPYQLGALSGMSVALRGAERITGQRGVDLEGIFYATAFQAGVDGFLIPDSESVSKPKSRFLLDRTNFVPRETADKHWDAVRVALSKHLPKGWERDDQYSDVWGIESFLVDLMNAMATRSCLLSPWSIPDTAQVEAVLPSELALPLSNLLGSITDLNLASPVPQLALPVEELQRFNEIITGDLFPQYVHAQGQFDNSEAPIRHVVDEAVRVGRALFLKHPRLFVLRKSCVGFLQVTPKLIDAVFGKLPGVLAEISARLGVSLLDSRRRIVIYDCRPIIEMVWLSNLLRMFKSGRVSESQETSSSDKPS